MLMLTIYIAIIMLTRTETFILPDPVNIGIAVGISWLSCVQAELHVDKGKILDFPLPVSSHLIVQHCHFSLIDSWTQKVVGISLISCVQAEIYILEA